eukprot:TRINITY_DN7502_c0_g2_i1.p1 TRINITY_DN7502_c0_g2~~TRINITY_DN7502_c0_g2_i1.p1  ORF type:complete len:464 (+),score=162.55 TRINITY_DN7502_c0_g2_i1:111-1394(+)
MAFSDPSRDPGHQWPSSDVWSISRKNREVRAVKIKRWRDLLDGIERTNAPRQPRYTRDQAAELLAKFQHGSMKRTGLKLVCHVTGMTFPAAELRRGQAVREEITVRTLTQAGVPQSVISFTQPAAPIPDVHHSSAMQGEEGEQFRKQASERNDEALANYRASMATVLDWARENLPDGPSAVHDALAAAADEISRASAKAGARPNKVALFYPDAEERKRLFHEVDMNGNGFLSLAELDLAVKTRWPEFDHKNAVIRAYKLADRKSNREGWLTRSDDEKRCEWSHFLKYLVLYNEYWHGFDEIDLNHDLSVDVDEWRANANRVFKLEGTDMALDPDELDVVFSEMDADGSGRVRFDEFCIWAAKVNGDRDLQGPDAMVDPGDSTRWRPQRMATLRGARQHQSMWNKGRVSERGRHGSTGSPRPAATEYT